MVKGLNKPRCTVKVEKVFADTFDAPAALLVRGSGTGAIRWALTACLKPGDAILVHTSPIYTTTQVTIDAMGLRPIRADFNDLEQLKAVCAQHKDEIRGALVQLTRQKPEDRYDYKAVIAAIKAALPGIPVVTDDNYAALKVDAIGCQAGADLSTFSCFKILGPEGVGAVIGSKELIDRIYKMQYSGGSQVQGHEAHGGPARPDLCAGGARHPERGQRGAGPPPERRRDSPCAAGVPGKRAEQGAAGGV